VEVLLAAAADPALLLPPPPAAATAESGARSSESAGPAAAAGGRPLPPPAGAPAPAPAPAPAGAVLRRVLEPLLPDPTLAELLDVLLADDSPVGLPALLRVLPRADLYLQDEVDVALLPTLTRVWCRKGRRGQRHVETPGTNAKQYGFGLVDWRDGWFDWALAPARSAAPFCDQLRRAVARSRSRGRVAIVLCDNLGIHTPTGSKQLRSLREQLGEHLVLVHTPRYDPDANRIEWLWRALRRAVTHCHTRTTLPPLLDDASAWATALTPDQALAHIGSPFAPAPEPPRTRPRARGQSPHRQFTRRPQQQHRHRPPTALGHAA
jgi:transposase